MRILSVIVFCIFTLQVSGFANPTLHIYMSSTNSEPLLRAKPRLPCVVGEKWSTSPSPDQPLRSDKKDFMRLQGRVRRLETLVHDLCCAIVYADDMALVERQMLQSGPIYQDVTTENHRPPILLRRETADIAWRHGNPVSPPPHKWH